MLFCDRDIKRIFKKSGASRYKNYSNFNSRC
nr:MAG TPA: hypothetical protein [Caudoviricetes sp.]